jgi:hypothetical protein
MFAGGFEKIALVGAALLGAGVGSLAGGEGDKETGEIKNRGIGALRGVGALLAGDALSRAAARKELAKMKKITDRAILANPTKAAKLLGHTGAALKKGIPAQILGSLGGYYALKHLGPKYDREKRST